MTIIKRNISNPYPLAFTLYVIWTLAGAWPLTCYESDSMHLIAGCDMMVQQGWQFPPVYSYGYDMQPLVTYIVAGTKRLFPSLTCEEVYCLMTTLTAIVLALLTVELVHRLTAIRREWILLGMFLIPESAAIAMYPNSAVFAAFFFVSGLWLTVKKRFCWGGLMLGIAPLFRMDVLIVYPVYPCLLWWMGYKWKESLGRSVLVAVWIVTFVSCCCCGLKANPIESLFAYHSFNETLAYSQLVIYAVVAFYTVLGLGLLPFGIYLSGKRKEWTLLAVALIPILLLHFMFRHTGCAAKHYLYLIPFTLLLTAPALQQLFSTSSKLVRWTLGVGIFLFLTVSVRISLPQYAWIDRQGAVGQAGPSWTLYKENVTPYRVSVGIGTGQVIPTADEYMLASGNLFYPLYIHRFKQGLEERTGKMEEYLSDKKNYDLLVFSWQDEYHYTTRLANAGFRIHREAETGGNRHFITHYTKEGEQITLHFEQISEKETARMKESIVRHAQCERETFIVTSRCDRTDSAMHPLVKEGCIEQVAERLYQIKKRI